MAYLRKEDLFPTSLPERTDPTSRNRVETFNISDLPPLPETQIHRLLDGTDNYFAFGLESWKPVDVGTTLGTTNVLISVKDLGDAFVLYQMQALPGFSSVELAMQKFLQQHRLDAAVPQLKMLRTPTIAIENFSKPRVKVEIPDPSVQ